MIQPRACMTLILAMCAPLQAQKGDEPSRRRGGGKLDTARIDELTGVKGAMNEDEGVYKASTPRTDVAVKIDGRPLEPFMGLTSWAAFRAGKEGAAMVMGDLVLFEDEVNPAMSAALDAGLQVTALHNHFFYDEPRVYFMHIGGEGPVEQLATGVRRALDAVKKIRGEHSELARGFGAPAVPTGNEISGKPLEEILGTKGQAKDGMFKVVIGRTARMACGCEVGKEMGVNTWAAFAGTDVHALVDGDFVVLEDELQGVLKALRGAGINVVAIHQHMIGETPRMIFLHYWGVGAAPELAKGIKVALNSQKDVGKTTEHMPAGDAVGKDAGHQEKDREPDWNAPLPAGFVETKNVRPEFEVIVTPERVRQRNLLRYSVREKHGLLVDGLQFRFTHLIREQTTNRLTPDPNFRGFTAEARKRLEPSGVLEDEVGVTPLEMEELSDGTIGSSENWQVEIVGWERLARKQ